MRTFFIGFLAFLAWTAFARHHYVCKIKGHCGTAQQSTDSLRAGERPRTLSLRYGDELILQGYEQFAFDSAAAQPQLSADNRAFLDSVANFLADQPDKNVKITGQFLDSEGGPVGMFENVGIARADAIRKMLAERGIAEARISVDYNRVQGSQLAEPLAFVALLSPDAASANSNLQPDEYDANSERLVTEAYSFTNMSYSDANFEYNSDVFKPGTAFQAYADSLKTYLDKAAGKKLVITGHTDSKGSDQYNDDLGLRRAKSARKYLQGKGIKSTIETETKGKREPVAPNAKPDGSDNPDGRAKNRRVNIKIVDGKALQ